MTVKHKQPHTMWPTNTAEYKYFKYCDEYNARRRQSLADSLGRLSTNVDTMRKTNEADIKQLSSTVIALTKRLDSLEKENAKLRSQAKTKASKSRQWTIGYVLGYVAGLLRRYRPRVRFCD